MDDESNSAQQSHWKRWSGETGPFYRACAVIPFRDTTDISSKTKPEIEVTSGITRWVLRNFPAVVICGAGAIPLRLWIRTVTAAIPKRFSSKTAHMSASVHWLRPQCDRAPENWRFECPPTLETECAPMRKQQPPGKHHTK